MAAAADTDTAAAERRRRKHGRGLLDGFMTTFGVSFRSLGNWEIYRLSSDFAITDHFCLLGSYYQ